MGDVYDPSRKTVAEALNYLKENMRAVESFAEYLTGGEIDSVEHLRPGQGGLLRKGLKKIAAARDEGGVLHLLSASCTHLECIVHWNQIEQCWDCPCHGSQFAPDGAVLSAPAVTPLGAVDHLCARRSAARCRHAYRDSRSSAIWWLPRKAELTHQQLWPLTDVGRP
jgi:Rieske Fe-S protein